MVISNLSFDFNSDPNFIIITWMQDSYSRRKRIPKEDAFKLVEWLPYADEEDRD